jgi:hypothetical protein
LFPYLDLAKYLFSKISLTFVASGMNGIPRIQANEVKYKKPLKSLFDAKYNIPNVYGMAGKSAIE